MFLKISTDKHDPTQQCNSGLAGLSHRLAQSLYWLEYDEILDRREISGELETKTRHRVNWVGVKVIDQESKKDVGGHQHLTPATVFGEI